MIEYRKIKDNDVETVRSLYSKFPDFPQPQPYMLPGEGKDGIVGCKDGRIVSACYVYYQ